MKRCLVLISRCAFETGLAADADSERFDVQLMSGLNDGFATLTLFLADHEFPFAVTPGDNRAKALCGLSRGLAAS